LLIEWWAVFEKLAESAKRVLADQRVRFVIVGGINTVLSFALFTLFQLTVGRYLGRFGYLASLVFSYAIAMCVAFVLHRKYVFKVKGNTLVDFGRFVVTNAVGMGLNAIILPLMVEGSGLDPIISQAITQFLVAIASYLLHKHFSFRRKAEITE